MSFGTDLLQRVRRQFGQPWMHAFQKKTRKTPVKDIQTAAQRLRDLLKGRA